MSRVFVSYRASDGKKDASRLAEDLARRFGQAQVFFDKADLTAGSSWRAQVLAELGAKPVVALLLTPDYFGASQDGQRRIDRADDPVRLEILAAMEAGATLLPLMTEGVGMPAAAELPAALVALRDHHALKLRTDDWANDFERLARDLARLGLKPLAGGDAPGPNAASGKPWRALLGVAAAVWLLLELAMASMAPKDIDSDSHVGVAVLLAAPLALAWITWRWTRLDTARAPRWLSMGLVVLAGWSMLSQLYQAAQLSSPGAQVAADSAPATQPAPQPQPLVAPPPAPPAAAPADPLSGTWQAQLANGQHMPMNLKLRDGRLTLQTQRIDIRQDASMAPLVLALAAQGVVLHDIRLRAEGDWDEREAELQLALQSGDGQRTLDTGHMQLMLAPDNRSLTGSLQFSNGQPVALVLRRP